jgi:hypothetical protein
VEAFSRSLCRKKPPSTTVAATEKTARPPKAQYLFENAFLTGAWRPLLDRIQASSWQWRGGERSLFLRDVTSALIREKNAVFESFAVSENLDDFLSFFSVGTCEHASCELGPRTCPREAEAEGGAFLRNSVIQDFLWSHACQSGQVSYCSARFSRVPYWPRSIYNNNGTKRNAEATRQVCI